ncbi:MAG: Ppx/GppA family phosphatase [candidate division Zixibacteria bacterium]|nr:Ppx/GppA family phosphatase [candidate division Zixibacteria bacterium]
MPMIGAIDVGTNAMRMAIGFVDGDRRVHVVEDHREPVRLGAEVFSGGNISSDTGWRAVRALKKFRERLDRHGVEHVRAVATSALREARNRGRFLERAARFAGIRLSVIGGEEEARLVHLAVAERVNLKKKLALLIDVGGGSVEISLVNKKRILAAESFKMGAVRLLQILEEKKQGEEDFFKMVQEYVEPALKRFRRAIGKKKIDCCIGVGGNIETLGYLKKKILNGDDNGSVSRREIEVILKRLEALTVEERMRRLFLRPDRADVIVPAAIVLHQVLKESGVSRALIPGVGLKEGILIDLIPEAYEERVELHRDQVLTSALQLGQKYAFDERHAKTVAGFAARLFDSTRRLHGLSEEDRLLLEVAAFLHDVGQYVGASGHHKHTFYILQSSPLIGLNPVQKLVVANAARYHRKSLPSLNHLPFKALPPVERKRVEKLAALLRLADALDVEHAGKVAGFSLQRKKKGLILRLQGKGDMLLERWALARKANLFEKIFRLKLNVAA